MADIFSSNPHTDLKKLSSLIKEFKSISIRLDARDAARLLTVRWDVLEETKPVLIDLISKSHNITRSVDQYVEECTNRELTKTLADSPSDRLATTSGTVAGSMLRKRQSPLAENTGALSQNDKESTAKESEVKFVKK